MAQSQSRPSSPKLGEDRQEHDETVSEFFAKLDEMKADALLDDLAKQLTRLNDPEREKKGEKKETDDLVLPSVQAFHDAAKGIQSHTTDKAELDYLAVGLRHFIRWKYEPFNKKHIEALSDYHNGIDSVVQSSRRSAKRWAILKGIIGIVVGVAIGIVVAAALSWTGVGLGIGAAIIAASVGGGIRYITYARNKKQPDWAPLKEAVAAAKQAPIAVHDGSPRPQEEQEVQPREEIARSAAEEERARLAEEARKAEEDRVAAEQEEVDKSAAAEEALKAEAQRLAAAEEVQRKAAAEREIKEKAAEAEKARLKAEAEEKARAEQEAKERAEQEAKAREEQEAKARAEEQLRLAAEEARKAEEDRVAAEAEKAKLREKNPAAEAKVRQKSAISSEKNVFLEIAERLLLSEEKIKEITEKRDALKAKERRQADLEVERKRIADENAQKAAEKKRIDAEAKQAAQQLKEQKHQEMIIKQQEHGRINQQLGEFKTKIKGIIALEASLPEQSARLQAANTEYERQSADVISRKTKGEDTSLVGIIQRWSYDSRLADAKQLMQTLQKATVDIEEKISEKSDFEQKLANLRVLERSAREQCEAIGAQLPKVQTIWQQFQEVGGSSGTGSAERSASCAVRIEGK